MRLSDEIQRLTGHFVEAHDDRAAAVAEIRTRTARELAESHATHQQMATEQRQRLAEDRARLGSDTATFMEETHAAMEETHAANRQMAEELRAHLDEQESARQAQGTEDARERAEYVEELDHDVDELRRDFRTAHQAMATEQRQRLAEDRARLASDVAAVRGELQADLSEAGQVWGSFAGQMQQHRAGRPIAAPPPPPSSLPKEEAAADDLTAIRGIGSGTQRRLNRARIFTYAQLAESTPEELRRILGEGAQTARAGEWIEQAQQLSGVE